MVATDDAVRSGITLHQFLTVVAPSPAQVAYLAVAVAEGLAAGTTPCRRPPRGPDAVLVQDDGSIRLTGACDLEAVLDDLVRSAERPALHRDVTARAVLGLLRSAAEGASRGADVTATLVRALHTATDGLDVDPADPDVDPIDDLARDSVREQTAALAAAMTSRALSPSFLVPDEGVDSTGYEARRVPAAPARSRGRRRRVSRWLSAAAAVAVLAVTALVLTGVLPDPLHPGSDSSAAVPQASARTPSVAPRAPARRTAGPAAVRLDLPRAAGFVTAVQLTPVHRCRAGTACPIRVTVQVRPVTSTQRVAWSFVVAERCHGRRHTVSGGVLRVEPGWRSAYDTRSVPLTARTAVAVFGITTDPVRVASAPLPVPARPTC